jgi:glycosyltransferase involved in cell wall biosynthesis
LTASLQVGVIGVSQELCDYLRMQQPRNEIFFIPNGIDAATVARAASEPSSYQRRPRWTVAIVGRLVPVKRVDLFLETAALLTRAQPERYHFVVVGDGPLLSEMRTLATRLGVAAEVDFLGFQSNSLAILRQMDCLVLTSDHEGLPMVVLEALALGVPMVAHAVGGLPEVLDGVAGQRLVTEHTAEGYAKAITELSSAPSPMSRKCLLPDRLEISQTAAAYVGLYRDLLAGTRSRPPSASKADNERPQ